jgi:hypothetical protein
LVAFSCRGRSFCPSCEKKRSVLWGEWLREEVLEAVPHRHTVMTIPRSLRRVFLRRRELLLDLTRRLRSPRIGVLAMGAQCRLACCGYMEREDLSKVDLEALAKGIL